MMTRLAAYTSITLSLAATWLPLPCGAAPNIVYILMDDAGYGDLSCYGQEKFSTPNIDRIAEEGMKFTQHYSGSTVCAPTRSVLMTGLHTGHTPNRGNKEIKPKGQHPMPADALTIAEVLAEGGYATGAFGKWGLGFPGSEGSPNHQGFERFYGYNCQRHAHSYRVDHLMSDGEQVPVDPADYSHDLIMDQCIAWMEEQLANPEKPFFCYIPSAIPHAAMDAPADVVDPIRKDYPQFEDKVGNYGGYKVTNPVAQFVGMMTVLDNEVGRVLDLLDKAGVADNTLVILSSDNGPHQEGGHQPNFFDSNGEFTGYKRSLTEGGIRAPMIARWPGVIPAGTTSDHISAHWDVFPTLCEAAGVETPEGLDGISMIPALKADTEGQGTHLYLYWEFTERGGKRAVRFGRDGRWKAIQRNIGKKNPDAVLLYDLLADPSEQNDLAKSNPEVVAEAVKYFEEAHTPSEIWSFPFDSVAGQ